MTRECEEIKNTFTNLKCHLIVLVLVKSLKKDVYLIKLLMEINIQQASNS